MLDKIAFGTYRTGVTDPEHEKALTYALEHGIRTIDASANYMFGDAERLIAKVLKNKKRENFFIISKGGYIQGPNMQRLNEGMHIEDLVRYDPSCYHSIHPDFLADQIDRSLERTESGYIDCYLLHNPEYYLMHTIKPGTTDDEAARHRNEMQERIAKAFKLLEAKVKEGKIRSYGISSNSFAKPENDPHFLEYRHLIVYAKQAGGDNHHFKAIQLPMNLLEHDGEAAAAWAKAEGLEVYINRPLNAFGADGMIRLADYPACGELEKLLASLHGTGNPALQQLLGQLMEVKNRFSWAGAVDDTIEYQVRPHLSRNLGITDPVELKKIAEFLTCYTTDVKHTLGQASRTRIETSLGTIEGNLEDFALTWLLKHPHVDKVLIGMRKTAYVEQVLQLVSHLK